MSAEESKQRAGLRQRVADFLGELGYELDDDDATFEFLRWIFVDGPPAERKPREVALAHAVAIESASAGTGRGYDAARVVAIAEVFETYLDAAPRTDEVLVE